MKISVEVWLRGTDFATTANIEGPPRAPVAWIDDDVQLVLEGMLRAMDRQKYSDGNERVVTLRGLSWIVNPYDNGGVLIAIEITLGAVIAGPFEIDKTSLETMIKRVIMAPAAPSTTRVH